MAGLPLTVRKTLKDKLGEVLTLKPVKVETGQMAKKVLFSTRDGARLESVMTLNKPFVCLSSMSGCNLGCKFCSTASMGLVKKLTADEIVDQVLYFAKNDHFHGHLTFMGMGEPLLNENNVFTALKIFLDPHGLNIGQRKISLSTVGIIPGIKRLTREFPQVNLTFSLHTPFNHQRSELMPVNKLYPLAQVMPVINQHIAKTKRKVFLAYLLLREINDSSEHAQALVKLINRQGKFKYLYHVNLIRFNSGSQSGRFQRSPEAKLLAFSDILTNNKIPHTLRQSFGEDIHAACGQLCVKMGLSRA
jgi:23S rRNA (adenine-C8)-methyltransferase